MKTWHLIVLVGVHIVLGQLMHASSIVSTLHAYSILGLGLYFALNNQRANVAKVAAYIVASEVLWRMTHAKVFWEFGKYALCAIFGLSLITRGWKKPFLPIIYFSFLIPSTILLPTMIYSVDKNFLDDISFNVSGPFTLMLSALFFLKTRIEEREMKDVLTLFLLPVISMFSIARYISASTEIKFTGASNWAASGGFGPNQVSCIFGLGAFCAYLLLFFNKNNLLKKSIFILIGLALATQGALTFSRGGVYTGAVAALAATFFLLQKRSNIIPVILIVGSLFLVGEKFIFPHLETYTEGKLQERYKKEGTSGRDILVRQDIEMFTTNPIFGVGPGQARIRRQGEMAGVAAHTEFTRMLAEHGVFGIFSMVFLGLMAFSFIKKAKFPLHRALASSFIVWALTSMSIYGMRVAAASYFFGFAAVTMIPFDIKAIYLHFLKSQEPSKSESA